MIGMLKPMIAGVLAAGTLGTGVVLARPASHPQGWRVEKTASSLTYGAELVVPSATSAWAFGHDGPDQTVQWPAAYRWDGRTWRKAALPGGRIGGITATDATGAANVWAVTETGTVLRWNGTAWSRTVHAAPPQPTALVTTGPADVWVFGMNSTGNRHYDGHRWTTVATPFSVFAADARSATDIWAAGRRPGGAPVIGHYDGTRWRIVPVKTPLGPQDQGGYDRLTIDGRNVWITGTRSSWTAHRTCSILTHYDGRTWSTTTITQAGLLRDGVAPVPDGRGGIWLLGSTDVNGYDSALVHRDVTGRWTRLRIRPATELLGLAGTGTRLFALADGKLLSYPEPKRPWVKARTIARLMESHFRSSW